MYLEKGIYIIERLLLGRGKSRCSNIAFIFFFLYNYSRPLYFYEDEIHPLQYHYYIGYGHAFVTHTS